MSSALSIYFATMTGNSESLAHQAAKRARADGWSVTVHNLCDVAAADLTRATTALFIVSTWGDGEPPGDCIDFFDALLAKDAPALPQLRYAVLGLGDRGYSDFNAFGRNLDERLHALGAQRLSGRLEADLDFDDTYAEWADAIFPCLTPLRS